MGQTKCSQPQSWGRVRSQPPRVGAGQITELNSPGLQAGYNVDFPYLVRGGADLPEPKCCETKQLPPETCLTTLENLVVSDHWAHFQLAFGQKGPPTAHKPASWWDQFRDPTCTRWPITLRKHWAQPPQADSPQSCLTEREQHSVQHSPAYEPWKGQGHWESPSKKRQYLNLILKE
jgi:hypothetical protein